MAVRKILLRKALLGESDFPKIISNNKGLKEKYVRTKEEILQSTIIYFYILAKQIKKYFLTDDLYKDTVTKYLKNANF